MDYSPNSEFEIGIFAERYEALSDTFIDMRRATDSFDKLIRPSSRVFELGLGTGYFAGKLLEKGHIVEGIQPRDEMLARLKQRQPNVIIRGEETLENYVFTNRYDAIVSHSSVFLVTRHRSHVLECNEEFERLIFQSFISNHLVVIQNLLKCLAALEPRGRLYVNIQKNPLPFAEVGPPDDPLRFEMVDCSYYLDERRVIKHFKSTFRGRSIFVEDARYCIAFSQFLRCMDVLDVNVSQSSDHDWLILSVK